MNIRIACAVVVAASGVAAPAASAQAIIAPGLYRLNNHPDAGLSQPGYGLRLDELVNVTDGKDNFTFDFNSDLSEVLLNYTGDTITISGKVFGGRDIGDEYADEALTGVYDLSFTYNVGVGVVPGDDDIIVSFDDDDDDDDDRRGGNNGSITTPTGTTIDLFEYVKNGRSFRLGDRSDDQGHRGFDGISGWGWLQYRDGQVKSSDWIFTLSPTPVPAPASLPIAGLGGLALTRRRRNR